MNRDPLEQELEALELPEIPAEIRSRIDCALEGDRRPILQSVWRRRLYQVAAAGLAIAASIAIVIFVIHGDSPPSGMRGPVAMPTKGEFHGTQNMRMTLALYMQAENKTGGALDSMLNADAAQPIGLARDSMFRAGSQSLNDLIH